MSTGLYFRFWTVRHAYICALYTGCGVDPGNGIVLLCFRDAGPFVGGSEYATVPKGAATEPLCDCGWEPMDPRNGVLLEA